MKNTSSRAIPSSLLHRVFTFKPFLQNSSPANSPIKNPTNPTMSISTKIPYSPLFSNTQFLKPAKISSFFSKPHTFSFSRPIITIQRIPTKDPIFTASSSPSASLQPIEELPPKLQEIVQLFQGVKDSRARYDQTMHYGKQLHPLDPKYKTRENKVQGCVSQVWVRAYLDDDKHVVFEADSDSVLTKGLAALLVKGLSGCSVEEILRVSPDFVALLGLQQQLTPGRNNGFLNMLKLMKQKALQVYMEGNKAGDVVNGSFDSSEMVSDSKRDSSSVEAEKAGDSEVLRERSLDGSESDKSSDIIVELKGDSSGGSGLGGRGMRIKEILEKELTPAELVVEDISYQHAGHAGVRGTDGETHFNVRVVSGEFEGKSLVKRHRLIYGLLQDELQSGLHALSIEAKTPTEVAA